MAIVPPGKTVPLAQQAVGVTPITSAWLARFKGVFQNVRGAFFASPGLPVLPTEVEDRPRLRTPIPGSNLSFTPREEGFDATPFDLLRNFAQYCDYVRICIEARKRQLIGLEWDVTPKGQGKADRGVGRGIRAARAEKPSAAMLSKLDKARAFLEYPDRDHTWDQWLDMALEERLVWDALVLYPWYTRGGDLYKVEIIQGDMMKILLDERGAIPDPPAPAYEQIVLGQPRSTYTKEEVLYLPQRVRTVSPYGHSEAEDVLFIINMIIRKRLKDLAHWTDSNIPRAFMATPPDWSPDQIEKWNLLFDALVTGNPEQMQKIIWVPGAGARGGSLPIHEFTPFTGDPEFDKFLMQLICAAYAVTPAEVGFTEDVNRSSGESQEDVTHRQGARPLARYVTNVINRLLAGPMGLPDVEFGFKEAEADDQVALAGVHTQYLANGAMQLDDVRHDIGLEPYGIQHPFIPNLTRAGILLIEDIDKDPAELGLGPGGSPLPPAGGAQGDDGEDDANDPGDGPSAPGGVGGDDDPNGGGNPDQSGPVDGSPEIHVHLGGSSIAKVDGGAPIVKGEYGCLMLRAPKEIASGLRAVQDLLDPADLRITEDGDDGLEDEPHLTVKYGIVTKDATEVQAALLGHGPVPITCGPLQVFRAPTHDVLYVSVDSPALVALNATIRQRLGCVDTQPTYVPHMTVAYLLPGRADKYEGLTPAAISGKRALLTDAFFSPAGEGVDVPLILADESSGEAMQADVLARLEGLLSEMATDAVGVAAPIPAAVGAPITEGLSVGSSPIGKQLDHLLRVGIDPARVVQKWVRDEADDRLAQIPEAAVQQSLFAARDDLRKWRRVVLKSVAGARPPLDRPFRSEAIPPTIHERVTDQIAKLDQYAGHEARAQHAATLFDDALRWVDEWGHTATSRRSEAILRKAEGPGGPLHPKAVAPLGASLRAESDALARSLGWSGGWAAAWRGAYPDALLYAVPIHQNPKGLVKSDAPVGADVHDAEAGSPGPSAEGGHWVTIHGHAVYLSDDGAYHFHGKDSPGWHPKTADGKALHTAVAEHLAVAPEHTALHANGDKAWHKVITIPGTTDFHAYAIRKKGDEYDVSLRDTNGITITSETTQGGLLGAKAWAIKQIAAEHTAGMAQYGAEHQAAVAAHATKVADEAQAAKTGAKAADAASPLGDHFASVNGHSVYVSAQGKMGLDGGQPTSDPVANPTEHVAALKAHLASAENGHGLTTTPGAVQWHKNLKIEGLPGYSAYLVRKKGAAWEVHVETPDGPLVSAMSTNGLDGAKAMAHDLIAQHLAKAHADYVSGLTTKGGLSPEAPASEAGPPKPPPPTLGEFALSGVHHGALSPSGTNFATTNTAPDGAVVGASLDDDGWHLKLLDPTLGNQAIAIHHVATGGVGYARMVATMMLYNHVHGGQIPLPAGTGTPDTLSLSGQDALQEAGVGKDYLPPGHKKGENQGAAPTVAADEGETPTIKQIHEALDGKWNATTSGSHATSWIAPDGMKYVASIIESEGESGSGLKVMVNAGPEWLGQKTITDFTSYGNLTETKQAVASAIADHQAGGSLTAAPPDSEAPPSNGSYADNEWASHANDPSLSQKSVVVGDETVKALVFNQAGGWGAVVSHAGSENLIDPGATYATPEAAKAAVDQAIKNYAASQGYEPDGLPALGETSDSPELEEELDPAAVTIFPTNVTGVPYVIPAGDVKGKPLQAEEAENLGWKLDADSNVHTWEHPSGWKVQGVLSSADGGHVTVYNPHGQPVAQYFPPSSSGAGGAIKTKLAATATALLVSQKLGHADVAPAAPAGWPSVPAPQPPTIAVAPPPKPASVAYGKSALWGHSPTLHPNSWETGAAGTLAKLKGSGHTVEAHKEGDGTWTYKAFTPAGHQIAHLPTGVKGVFSKAKETEFGKFANLVASQLKQGLLGEQGAPAVATSLPKGPHKLHVPTDADLAHYPTSGGHPGWTGMSTTSGYMADGPIASKSHTQHGFTVAAKWVGTPTTSTDPADAGLPKGQYQIEAVGLDGKTHVLYAGVGLKKEATGQLNRVVRYVDDHPEVAAAMADTGPEPSLTVPKAPISPAWTKNGQQSTAKHAGYTLTVTHGKGHLATAASLTPSGGTYGTSVDVPLPGGTTHVDAKELAASALHAHLAKMGGAPIVPKLDAKVVTPGSHALLQISKFKTPIGNPAAIAPSKEGLLAVPTVPAALATGLQPSGAPNGASGFTPKEWYVDPKTGEHYMHKLTGTTGSYGNSITGALEPHVNHLQHLAALPGAEAVYSGKVHGKHGSLHKLTAPGGTVLPDLHDQGATFLQAKAKLAKLTKEQHLQLAKHAIFDWLIADHDAHGGNLKVHPNGDILGIDHGQAFKALGNDKLDPTAFKVNPTPTVWAHHFKAAMDDPEYHYANFYNTPALAQWTADLAAVPDAHYRELLRPYAEMALAKGHLPGAAHGSIDQFLDLAVARKTNLVHDWHEYFTKVEKARATKEAEKVGYKDHSVDFMPKGDHGKAGATAVTNAEAKGYMSHYWNTTEHLTASEASKLKSYKGSGFGPINAALRKHKGNLAKIDAAHQAMAASIDQALAKTPFHEDLIVHRGTVLHDAFPKGAPKPGMVWTDHGYLSTSLGETPVFSGSVVLHIRVPAGTPTMNLDAMGLHTSERELLLPRGSTFYIHHVTKQGGTTHVDVELVPPHQQASAYAQAVRYGKE